jgi:hypothetical protein
MKTIDDALIMVRGIRDRYVDYAGNGRCANWDEYTKISGAVTACEKVLAELENLRGDFDED